MWEKLSDYFLDISKYLITATFITTFVGDMGGRTALAYLSGQFYLGSGTFRVRSVF